MQLILVFFLYFVFTTLPALGGFSQPARQTGGDTTCGIVWDEPILLSDTAYDAHSPKIALSGDDTVHVVWESEKPSLRLPYCRLIEGGRIFEPVRELLLDSTKFTSPSIWNHVVAEGNNVYVFSVGSTNSRTPIRMNFSSDAGTTWEGPHDISNDSTGLLNCVAIHRDTIAIVFARGYRYILRSTDAGSSWTKTSEDLSVYSQIALTSSALHLVYDRGINSSAEVEYRISHDLGDTWSQTAILSEIDGYWSDMPVIASNKDSLIMVAWRDTKYGCLGVFGCGIIARTGIVNNTKDTNYFGEEEILTEKPRGYRAEAFLLNGMRAVGWVDEVKASDTFHVVTRFSKNKTQGWCSIIDHTPGIRDAYYPVLALSNKTIHIAWVQLIGKRIVVFYRRGVFKTTDMKDDNNVTPTEITLSQNYPNPFNPKTNINYQLPIANLVTLKVFDVFGREVSTLVNEKKQAGEYSVEWDASTFSSGVYFIRMNAGKYFSTKKAILIR